MPKRFDGLTTLISYGSYCGDSPVNVAVSWIIELKTIGEACTSTAFVPTA